jgi:hypothetical protein
MKFTSRSKLRFVALLGAFALAILAWAFFRPRMVLGDYSLGAVYKIAPLREGVDGHDSPDAVLAAELREHVLERVRETDSPLSSINVCDPRFEFRVSSDKEGLRWLKYRFAGYSTVHWDFSIWGFQHGGTNRADVEQLNGVMETAIIDELRERGWTRVVD